MELLEFCNSQLQIKETLTMMWTVGGRALLQLEDLIDYYLDCVQKQTKLKPILVLVSGDPK